MITHIRVGDEIDHVLPNYNSAAVEVRGWISDFMPRFTKHMIVYPRWD